MLLLVCTSLTARETNVPSAFELVVSFGSMGTGTSSDDFLKDYVKKFCKKNKVTIPAFKVGGCGREGEYKVLFSLKKLKKFPAIQFTNGLKTLIARQEQKNRNTDHNSGNIILEYHKKMQEFTYCREPVTAWQ